MSNSDQQSGQIAIGNTGGSVMLYSTTPILLPIQKFTTSASRRFTSSNHFTSAASKRMKKKRRIGRSTAIVGSSIDRTHGVEAILLLKKMQCVMIATRLEVECISFENKIRWTWSFTDATGTSMGWDALEKKVMIRGIPIRLHGDHEDQFVLASFGFFSFKESKSKDTDENDEDDANDNDNEHKESDEKDEENGATMNLDASASRPDLYSPILKIDVATGKFSNVVPMERSSTSENGATSDEWKECVIGTRAMAIYDKYQYGNIIGVFITYTSTVQTISNGATPSNPVENDGTHGNDDSDSITAIQELMVLDSDHRILHRATIPTKSSGTKLITVEAINQSPNGDYTVSATSRGGLLVYKTDGLQLLGAYGEGVSLHGHSIVWQDIFFIRIDRDGNNDTNGGEKSVWGQVIENSDELMRRERYKESQKNLSKQHDSLSDLFIVSVPSAFREPADMKEHIQFWDVSSLEFDGGNKLPSFELLAPKKSEGICTLLYDHSTMTSNAGKFILSTHAGDCLEMMPTSVTDWAGQMYPTGFIVLDNNLAYIEDEDELDQVIDSHIDYTNMCQGVGIDATPTVNQSEAEFELALQVSMMDEPIDVVGDDEDWNESLLNVAPCRPEPHLRVKAQIEAKDGMNSSNSVENSTNPNSVFDLMKQLPSFGEVQKASAKNLEDVEKRRLLIEETKLKMSEGPIKIPRRKAGNIDFLVNASLDKQLKIHMLEKMGPASGDGSILRFQPIESCQQDIPVTSKAPVTNEGSNSASLSPIKIKAETGDDAVMAEEVVPGNGKTTESEAAKEVKESDKTTELQNNDTKKVDISKSDGTSKPEIDSEPKIEEQEILDPNCPACQGRFVIHACGKRAKPIDYDAIAKAEQDKKDAEEEEKRKLLQERRKLAEQKRKEKKLKLKEEAQRKRREEEEEKKRKESLDSLARLPQENSLDLTQSASFDPNESGANGLHAPVVHQQQTFVTQNSIDYYPADQSSHLQSPSNFQQNHHSQSPHSPLQTNSIYEQHEVDAKPASQPSPSFGNVNFGDSIFSNLPTLPSEPSSTYYQNGNDGRRM